jgi:hypothetical protein
MDGERFLEMNEIFGIGDYTSVPNPKVTGLICSGMYCDDSEHSFIENVWNLVLISKFLYSANMLVLNCGR